MLLHFTKSDTSPPQALLKKHETVMADVDAFAATISSLEEQSKKCKVQHMQ